MNLAVIDPGVFVAGVFWRHEPPNVTCQDEAGRLWDIVSMLRFAIKSGRSDGDRIEYSLNVRNDNRRPKLVKLVAFCGAHDMDAPEPAITVMMPGED